MGRPRSEFKELLDTIEGATVYGQKPEDQLMEYPAIRYEKDLEDTIYADGLSYIITDRYQVTCIEHDPNTPIAKRVRELPMCAFNRFYVADNLNHTVYSIFF